MKTKLSKSVMSLASAIIFTMNLQAKPIDLSKPLCTEDFNTTLAIDIPGKWKSTDIVVSGGTTTYYVKCKARPLVCIQLPTGGGNGIMTVYDDQPTPTGYYIDSSTVQENVDIGDGETGTIVTGVDDN